MKQLLESIKYNNRSFPRDQLLQIIERREEAVPHLLEIVKEFLREPEAYNAEESRIDLLYALYLLAQFREKALFPDLLQILQLPSETLDIALGDTVTEGAGRMLASVFNGDVQGLRQLAENTGADVYAREQGLVALVALVLCGELERGGTVEYLGSLLTGDKLNVEDYTFNAFVVRRSTDLHPVENAAVIRAAFEKDAVDQFLIGPENVEAELSRSVDEVLEESRQDINYRLILDTIEEIEYWACFKELSSDQSFSGLFGLNRLKPVPVVTPPKIGRNDPCPCGSGKKHKKCCGK